MKCVLIGALLFGLAGTAPAATYAKVELNVSGSKFVVGQPIPYEVKVTSLRQDVLPYLDCPRYQRIVPSHTLTISDKSGKPLPTLHWDGDVDVMCKDGSLQPGQSVTFKSYVNQWAVLSKPGTYKVTASWLPNMIFKDMPVADQSEPVTIEIAVATREQKDGLLAKARKQMAETLDPEQKADAVWILAYTLDARAIPDLVAAGQDDLVEQDVVNALLRFPDQNAVRDELLKQLREVGPTDPLVRELARFKVPASKSVPLLKSWIEKGAPEQRAAALFAIAITPDVDESLRPLIEKQLKDPDKRVREWAQKALDEMAKRK